MTEKTTDAVKRYAGIYLLDIPFAADMMYTYYIPGDLLDKIARGAFVVVPFGGGNRKQNGVVFEISEKSEAKNPKPVLSVSENILPLDDEQLDMCKFLVDTTLCTFGDAVRAVTPSALARSVRIYSPTGKEIPAGGGSLTEGALLILDYIRSSGSANRDLLVSKFGAIAKDRIKELLADGYITDGAGVLSGGAKYEKYYSLAVDGETAVKVASGGLAARMKRKLTLPSQIGIINLLALGERDEKSILEEVKGASAAQLSTMVENGLLRLEKREKYRIPYGEYENTEKKEILPSDEQRYAIDELKKLSNDGKPHAALLFGVTGSGKTTVIIGMIDENTAKGRGVILLLPEISLTPQMLGIFCSRYGKRVAVMHSGLSDGERFDAYTRVRNGQADIVIGTRSAVFAPVKNLGMIVIDEEQEHTYKSDMNPKYHARDAARWRCARNSALMLLSSATPSVESFKKAKEGVYSLIKLESRYGDAELPTVTVADMRGEAHSGNITPIGAELADALMKTYERREQSVLFLNRRGYNTFVSCAECGSAVKCPSCSVAMTYHTKKGEYENGELVCHWCGKRMKLPEKCPTCGSKHLIKCGFGTQRVERELETLLPDAKILRMDADTTSVKFAYDKLLSDFRESGDILLGTQMVTKGHDFPNVTLVGVLLADMSLYLDDYRANERTFALLTQVIGRAGRAEKPGRALIQTNNPDNDVIKLACRQDYESFYENEIKQRKLLTFPPFCDIALIGVSHGDEHELSLAVKRLSEILKKYYAEYSDVPNITFGPFEAPVYKVDNKYRMRFVIKCRLNKRSREMFSKVIKEFGGGVKKPQISIDFNPTNL